ncbi:hypothetical protein CEXT_690361 [Caerostris extrusa]|uniref:Uncharacterized protein n=1 Tax=Caerostris extrusa TaxID=172846 RepID=A0AAV4SBX9_CAEEX|nr:hypothetical protein CEXT_690361 [Caerostris extrusa]
MKDKEMRPVHKREKTLFRDFMRCPFNVKLRIAVDPSFYSGNRKAVSWKYSLFYISVPFGRLKALELPAEGRRTAEFCSIPLSHFFLYFSREKLLSQIWRVIRF